MGPIVSSNNGLPRLKKNEAWFASRFGATSRCCLKKRVNYRSEHFLQAFKASITLFYVHFPRLCFMVWIVAIILVSSTTLSFMGCCFPQPIKAALLFIYYSEFILAPGMYRCWCYLLLWQHFVMSFIKIQAFCLNECHLIFPNESYYSLSPLPSHPALHLPEILACLPVP